VKKPEPYVQGMTKPKDHHKHKARKGKGHHHGQKEEEEYEVVEEHVEEVVKDKGHKGKKPGKKSLLRLNVNEFEENI